MGQFIQRVQTQKDETENWPVTGKIPQSKGVTEIQGVGGGILPQNCSTTNARLFIQHLHVQI